MPRFSPTAWYAYCFLGEFVLIYPTYLIMMQETGITPSGLAVLMVIWSGTTVLFEVPSGVLGDLWPRKRVMLLATGIEAMAFVIWLVAPSFWGFALAFTVWSLGGALASGTADAYLYEALEDKDSFQQIYARTEAVESFGAAAALFLGGFVAAGGYELPLILSVAAPAAGGLILWLFLPRLEDLDHTRAGSDEEESDPSFTATLRSGTRLVLTHRTIRMIVLASAALLALAGSFEEYVGVLFREHAFTLQQVGMIYGGVWLARTLGSLAAGRLHGATLRLPLLLFLTTGAALLGASMGLGLWGFAPLLVALLAFFAAEGTSSVIYGTRIQRSVRDHHRATVTSIQGVAMEVAAIGYFLLLGAAAELVSWTLSLQGTAVAAALLSLIWLILYREGSQSHD